MKTKIIKKFWGIGLIVMLLASLFVVAAPASAGDPLTWNMEIPPGATNNILVAGLDIYDMALAGDGSTIYAVGKLIGTAEATVTATVTANFTNTGGATDNYTVAYLDQDGVASTGTFTMATSAVIGATVNMTLGGTDTGVIDVTNVTATTTINASTGAFSLSGVTSATVLGTATYAAVWTDAGTLLGGSDFSKLYKSANAGASWVDITTGTMGCAQTDFVAVAPDDPLTVVVVDGTTAPGASTAIAYVSTNGGATFDTLGQIEDASGTNDAAVIKDVAVSSQVAGGTRYIACPGSGTSGTPAAALFYFNLGAASPDWKDAVEWGTDQTGGTDMLNTNGETMFWSVAFSPNFSSDYMAVAVSETTGTNGTLDLHVASFNSYKWDTSLFPGLYPANIQSVAVAGQSMVVSAADVALSPDYMGGDDVLRVSFTGAALTDNSVESGGIFRMNDNIYKELTASPAAINSVAFNGTSLVGGAYDTNVVYRCADPLATTPTVLPSRSFKRIGTNSAAPANDQVIVAWNGEDVLGVKRGEASAFSVSSDSGMVWNDISLMDSALTNIDSVYATGDGSAWYIAARDAGEASLYRNVGGVWQRILCDPVVTNANILRGDPNDNDVIYVGQKTGTAMYYSSDAGLGRWYARTAPGNITDYAADGSSNVYVGTGTSMRKSTNNGFTWGPPVTPELQGDAVATITVLGTDNLIIGGNAGHVSYTMDGGASWVKVALAVTGAGNAHVTASGLADGDFIYAASSGGALVERWTIGQPPAWKNLLAGDNLTSAAYSIALKGGALYVLQSNGTSVSIERNLLPHMANPNAAFWSTIGDGTASYGTTQTPQALVTSSGSTKLWIISGMVYSYVDTLADAAPGLVVPANGALIGVNAVTGAVYNQTFTWTRPSLATTYNVIIALDGALTQRVVTVPIAATTLDTISTVVTPNTVALTPGTTYYWGVEASGPISSARSEVRKITIQPGTATVPAIGSPINGSMGAGKNPAFSWSPVSGAAMYEFQLAVSTNFANPLFSDTMAVTGVRPPVKLDAGTTYFWRVRAIDPVEGEWSTIANFTVAEEAAPVAPPIQIVQTPPPVIEIPAAPPAPVIQIPAAPPAQTPIDPGYILAIIIIGAVLVIAVIVLIVRTRRTV